MNNFDIYPLLLTIFGLFYLIWGAIALLHNKFGLILNSYRLLPQLARLLGTSKLLRTFFLYIEFLLQQWKFIYWFRYLFGPTFLVILISIFLYRLYQGNALDLLWLPLAFIVTIFTHEFGHALAYAYHRIFVMSVQLGFPVLGKTRAILSIEKLPNDVQAFIGFAGSATNLLFALISIVLFIFFPHPLLMYLTMTNVCFLANAFFAITKDYHDIYQYMQKAFHENG